ncbi:hypothetical protein NO995_07365 [Aestuariibaculum sp. M13]|uniref:hypothetical protein n=1 Tax=Aestuariibaculum sp. M13 TaxID=2967132 RepID=UPI00215A09EE|nr:hypothetical protein [Aestuariibaculum sp. M13]MCR8667493.1 hypothetical protein [Aestuariibaculum sp. M13]
MALTDFFRINFPYGMKKNSKGEWFVFNREYVPIGFNTEVFKKNNINRDTPHGDLPIYAKYKKLTDSVILEIVEEETNVKRNKQGEIETVWFYNDETNPRTNPVYWDLYFYIIMELSKLEIAQ